MLHITFCSLRCINDLPSHWILFITFSQPIMGSEINLKPKVVIFLTKTLNILFLHYNWKMHSLDSSAFYSWRLHNSDIESWWYLSNPLAIKLGQMCYLLYCVIAFQPLKWSAVTVVSAGFDVCTTTVHSSC
jgi:hypothetical protein